MGAPNIAGVYNLRWPKGCPCCDETEMLGALVIRTSLGLMARRRSYEDGYVPVDGGHFADAEWEYVGPLPAHGVLPNGARGG